MRLYIYSSYKPITYYEYKCHDQYGMLRFYIIEFLTIFIYALIFDSPVNSHKYFTLCLFWQTKLTWLGVHCQMPLWVTLYMYLSSFFFVKRKYCKKSWCTAIMEQIPIFLSYNLNSNPGLQHNKELWKSML